MMSRALAPFVTSIEALDLSSKMVERFNELAASSEIPSFHTARAREGNLLDDHEPTVELKGPEFHDFDVVTVGAALHHFDDPAKAIGRLAQRLRPDGVLLIIDFVEEEQQGLMPHGAEDTIRKHGFSEVEMKELMEGHGLRSFGWMEMSERVELMFQEDKPISRKAFLARATKIE